MSATESTNPEQQQQIDPAILQDASIESIASFIAEQQPRNIIVMTGAGISTAAGIPDFRTPGTGLYDNLQKYNLPYPTAVFDIKYFHKRPEAFYALSKELYPSLFKPTVGHYFIRLLAQKQLLLRNYTQNIDTLERIAGIDPELLVEAHGSFGTARCVGKLLKTADPVPKPPGEAGGESGDSDDEDPRLIPGHFQPPCGATYSKEWVYDQIIADGIPRCTNNGCGGLVKPDIVFFGESLPDRYGKLVPIDFPKCDLLIVIGTSLKVYPFARLIDGVDDKVPRLLINREEVGSFGHKVFGFDFEHDKQEYHRDALFLGSCDEGVLRLAELLGWKDELLELVEREHKALEALSAQHAVSAAPASDRPAAQPVPGEGSGARNETTVEAHADETGHAAAEADAEAIDDITERLSKI